MLIYLFQTVELSHSALIMGYIVIAFTVSSAIVAVVWTLWNKQNQAHWKDLVESQAKKIGLIQTELSDLRLELSEIKRALTDSYRINEDLRKANFRLQGILEASGE